MRQFPPTHFRCKSWLLMSLSCLALAGCGGGEGDSASNIFTISANPGGTGMFGSYFMASITQEWRDAAASFRNNSPRFTIQTVRLETWGTPSPTRFFPRGSTMLMRSA